MGSACDACRAAIELNRVEQPRPRFELDSFKDFKARVRVRARFEYFSGSSSICIENSLDFSSSSARRKFDYVTFELEFESTHEKLDNL